MLRTVLTMSALALVAATVAAVVALSAVWSGLGGPAGASSPREDPAVFLTRIVGFVVADDYERAWPSLYPAHQGVAPRSEYVACELRTPVGWTLRSVDVVRVVKRLTRIPGETERDSVTLVTLRLRLGNETLHTENVFAHTFKAVAVGSRWTWILTPSRYRLYSSDGCLV